MTPGFYDPHTRTFRPFCRQALLTMALGPLAGLLVALVMAVLP
jgi:hypothetical protein